MQVLYIEGRRNGYGLDQCGRTMTVAELIDYLSQFDEELPVYRWWRSVRLHRREVHPTAVRFPAQRQVACISFSRIRRVTTRPMMASGEGRNHLAASQGRSWEPTRAADRLQTHKHLRGDN
jgi:hypothetical protein